MITTNLPPAIIQHFNTYLLDPLLGLYRSIERILKLGKRKIRSQDKGKQREFEWLSKLCVEAYERKKIEEAEYKAKAKNFAQRPSTSASGGTCRFRRFQDTREELPTSLHDGL